MDHLSVLCIFFVVVRVTCEESVYIFIYFLGFTVGFLLCHGALAQEQPNRLWASALESGWVVALFRDEVLHIHGYIQGFFDGIKGYGKRVNEVKDCYNQAVQKA